MPSLADREGTILYAFRDAHPAGAHVASVAPRPLRIAFVAENEPFYMAETFRRLIAERPEWAVIDSVGLLSFSPVGTRGGTRARVASLVRTFGLGTAVAAVLGLARHRILPSQRLPAVLKAGGVRLVRLEDVKGDALVRFVEDCRPDVVVTLGLNRLLPQELLASGATQWINAHLGDVERHRGAAPVFWALHDGDMETAVSVHLIVGEVDAGAVLAMCRLPITRRALFPLVRNLRRASVRAIYEALDRLRHGDVPSTPARHLPAVQKVPTASDVRRFRASGNRFI